jgi:hypothetical protein
MVERHAIFPKKVSRGLVIFDLPCELENKNKKSNCFLIYEKKPLLAGNITQKFTINSANIKTK